MDLESITVSLERCRQYDGGLKEKIERLCSSLSFPNRNGLKVLLKPNLVAASGHDGLAVTNPHFVAAVAEWLIDHGAEVAVGDSPAFGSGQRVMAITGIADAISHLPVQIIPFSRKRKMRTASGLPMVLAAEIFEYDFLINLPKVKAHGQTVMTLAVKNYFGVVLAWRKALAHMRYGGPDGRFFEMLVELLELLPNGVSIADGIVAMHVDGPVSGRPFPLSVIGACENPVALDAAFYAILGLSPQSVPLWQECRRRKIYGSYRRELSFPRLNPDDLVVKGFEMPARLSPVRFDLSRFLLNSLKKFFRVSDL